MNVALRRKILMFAVLALVLGAVIYGFLPRAAEVDIASVRHADLQVAIEEEGKTRLKERYIVTAPVAGYMRRISVKAGDEVKKGGQLIALEPLRSPGLDPRSRAAAENTVIAAQAALTAAQDREKAAIADADYTAKRWERMKSLFAKGYIAKDQFDQISAENTKAQAMRQSAAAAGKAAAADVARAETALKNYAPGNSAPGGAIINIKAPSGGSVFRVYRESEGAVNVGEPLLEIGDTRNLEVRVDVLSTDAVKIKKGTPVIFRRWGGAGDLSGVVRVVEPSGFTKISSLGVEEQRVLIIADITSPAEMWRALGDGFRLEAHFIIWEGKNVLQIPTNALFRSGKDWAVYVAQSGRAALRIVEIGQRNGLAAEIITGLQEGEKVIVHPDDTVKDGGKIKVKK